MIEELANNGVVSEADAEGHNEMLGFKLDGHLQRWRPTARKMARFVSAGRWLLRKQVQITDFVIPSDDEMDAVGPVLEELMQQNAEQLEAE